ncbi:ubl carboxyl-terminal hydrolase 18 isoform X4 [Notamacropus eugenii]|uniref:ubl carboxyl-terminal hydrolase 18 isoform X4 n=1 Tax=Notamacropus eugenii TaxID=9315 RepID=UPI003B67D510
MKKKTEKLRYLCSVGDSYKGPVGLYNIGQTCCLNSLLQMFIMNMNFTKILKSITMPRELEERKRSVPYQLLLLLEKMQDSRLRAIWPVELVSCLQKYNVPLFVDHDAAQLFLTLWNLIQSQITDLELSERLKTLYTIRIQESMVCLDCNVKNHRDSSMLTLSLPLFDTDAQPLKTLEDSLHCFFQPRKLSGQNKCFCEECGKLTYWQQQYELFAVIAHMGTASHGHYCAYICNPADGRWFCFNDSNVCWVTWEDIKRTYGNCHLYWGETAYLLVYKKNENQLASSPDTSMTVR